MDKQQKYINFLLLLGAFILLLPFLKVLIDPNEYFGAKDALGYSGIKMFFNWFFKNPFYYYYYILGGILLAIGLYLDLK